MVELLNPRRHYSDWSLGDWRPRIFITQSAYLDTVVCRECRLLSWLPHTAILPGGKKGSLFKVDI